LVTTRTFLLSVLLAGLLGQAAAAAPGHFLCYRARDVAVPRFASRRGVMLADEIESGAADVKKPMNLCTPADKNGEGVTDAATHLEAYRLVSHVRHVKLRNVAVENQFGRILLDTVRADTLLVPTAKNLTTQPAPPASSALDHYKCYRVRLSAGQPPFAPVEGVRVADQFQTKFFDLKSPRHLCVPVSTNGQPISDALDHELCYQVRLSTTPPQARLGRLRGLYVNNDLGPGRLDTVTEQELCVPSTRQLVVRGSYGKDSSATTFDHIIAAGFTVVDRGAYQDALDALPSGTKGWVWLGDYDNTTCTWEKSDDWIRSHVSAIAGHPKIAGYYIADEPHVWECSRAPSDVRARATLVKSLDPGPPTFIVLQPHSPGNPYTPYVGTVDVIGVERFPCSYDNGCVMTKIDDAIQLAAEAGVPRYWAIIQAFADSYYRLPTADELREEFRRWRLSRMEGYLVFSWNYGTETLDNHPDLVEVLKAENAK
jgi:hypothetical protein